MLTKEVFGTVHDRWLQAETLRLTGSTAPPCEEVDIVQPNPRVQVWDLGVRADTPLHHWMLAIGEAEEKVEEVAYTDGSKAPDGLVGAGVVLRGESWHKTLSRHSTVYEGEVAAVVAAVERSRAGKLLILTDC